MAFIRFYTACRPPILANLSHPEPSLLATYKGTDVLWCVLALDPWAHLTQIYSITRPDNGVSHPITGPPWFDNDTIVTGFHTHEARPPPGTTVVYDVGAHDFALLYDTTGFSRDGIVPEVGREIFRLVIWATLFLSFVLPAGFLSPTSRSTDITTALHHTARTTQGICMARTTQPLLDDVVLPHPTRPRQPSSIQIPEDSTLPNISPARSMMEVLQPRLTVPIDNPSERQVYADGVERLFLIEDSTRLAMVVSLRRSSSVHRLQVEESAKRTMRLIPTTIR
jgi:hypothetical protein